jgi:transmembrane sensor
VLRLSTDTKICVRLSGRNREVCLPWGGTYFDIAHDVRRPFDVAKGDTAVQALGPAFTVHLRESERVDVLVTQSRASIEKPKGPSAHTGPGPDP